MKKLLIVSCFAAATASTAMAEGLIWSGDFRLRDDYINQKETPVVSGEKLKSNTLRLRARLGAIATPTEDVKFEARLATSKGGTSTNQTLADSANKNGNYEFNLDRAVVYYTGINSVVLSGGRMAVPFVVVGGSDMVWDGDENLDGLTAGYKTTLSSTDLMLNLGSYQILQTKTATGKESNLLAYQVAAKQALGETKLLVHAAFYDFGNTRQVSPSNGSATAVGTNTTVAAGRSDFQVLNAGFQFDVPTTLPVSLFFDFAKNTGGKTQGKDIAYLAGLKLNTMKEPGSWFASYDYRNVEKNSVVDAFTDSDSFINGGTDGKGHHMVGGYQINKALNFQAAYFNGKALYSTALTDRKYQRVFLDLVAKF
ncbi:MAG: putative porin [Bacteriovorax sp.]|jgi:hypothetical protein